MRAKNPQQRCSAVRDFFVEFVFLCVSCSCIPYGDKIVGFSYIMPCRRQFD